MPKYRFDIEQNTDEWFAIKIGKLSASTSNSLLMDKKTKGYQDLLNKIVEERITGEKCENDQFRGNWATERGHLLEPLAREDYELRTLNVVKQIGVVELDKWVLCSPDGLINNDGLHQIKCPIFSTHREYLHKFKDGKKVIDKNYYNQLQFELYVTGRDYNIFTSYHPNLKSLDIEVKRDENLISEIQIRIDEFKKEVKEQIEIIKNY